MMSVNMYEERRSEQSTHNTSYASVDLKEEYNRKLNELELEKEELEFFKRKYKRKVEKFNQEKRNYKAKVSEIVRKTTPKHTEESFSEESNNFKECAVNLPNTDDHTNEELVLQIEKAKLYSEKESLIKLKEQIEVDLIRLRREKINISSSETCRVLSMESRGFSKW
jgi:hypothetical protein